MLSINKNVTFFALLLFLGFQHKGFSQPTDPKIPLDPAVRTGKLANGFTYYIRHNVEPANRVVMYLANKVGSVLEDDDQRGLAHFMEHMSFNGTAHFPKNQLVNYLQKVGVRFGADLNAYTSFDETVYQLPFPSDDPEVLKNGFQIMRDWANGATLETSEINSERGVVLEEKRMHKGASERMQQQFFPVITNHSRYAVRVPIGTDSVLNNFGREQIYRFYHDWYRPDLQALIVVGDIDVDATEKTIKAKFADLKNPDNEKQRTDYHIDLTGTNQFIALADPEITSTNIQVLIKRKSDKQNTVNGFNETIRHQLFNLMLGMRFYELSKQPDASFIKVQASIGGFMVGLDSYSLNIESKPEDLEKSFKTAWSAADQIKKSGFTATEFARAKLSVSTAMANAIKNKDKTNSVTYVKQYLQHFLKGSAAPDFAYEDSLVKKILPLITLDEVNKLAAIYITNHDRDIIVMGPDKSKVPHEPIINKWISEADEAKKEAYTDKVSDKPLLSSPPIPGKIISEKKNAQLDITELKLSNGVKVYLKPTTFRNEAVNMFAFAPGGSSLYPDADYYSANNAVVLVNGGGIGNYNSLELGKYLAGKSAVTTPYISEYYQGVNAFSQTATLENGLQLLYAYFTEPRKDEQQFQNIIKRAKASALTRGNNPGTMLNDTLGALLNNYAPRYAGSKPDAIASINFDDAYRIYKERFADASNFTFVMVGNFEIDKIKPLLEKYLAALPATYKAERSRNLDIHIAKGRISKTLYKGIEPKATVSLVYWGKYSYSQKSNLVLDGMTEVLKIRLTERLRESESGVYTPGVGIEHRKFPESTYRLAVSFTCAPENVEKLIASTNDEIEQLRKKGPSQVNVDKFKIENKKARETYTKTNKFWLEYIGSQLQNNEKLDDLNHYDDHLNGISADDLKQAARRYLTGGNYIRVVLLPESSKPDK